MMPETCWDGPHVWETEWLLADKRTPGVVLVGASCRFCNIWYIRALTDEDDFADEIGDVDA
jgi:hypothetical protein